MLDLVQDESLRIESRFLEPACGSGNFLVAILKRKLSTVQDRYGKNQFEYEHRALVALMSIYGIELLADNAQECRDNLHEIWTNEVGVSTDSNASKAAKSVLRANIVQGDALNMQTSAEEPAPIIFPEWSYVGNGKFQRRDFRFQSLTLRSELGSDTLFGNLSAHEIFTPVREYPPMTMQEIAND